MQNYLSTFTLNKFLCLNLIQNFCENYYKLFIYSLNTKLICSFTDKNFVLNST